ncbi:MAG: arylsulfatase [Halioglobus sp.]
MARPCSWDLLLIRWILVAVSLSVPRAYASQSAEQISESYDKPNILVVLIDDLGYSDLGVFGSEIRTPTIDALASSGVTFGDFHAGMTCSPTRAMLLTGMDHHLVGLGNMAGHVSENQKGRPGYEGYLNHKVDTVATTLRGQGYTTFMAGKWHLGMVEPYRPSERGFDHSFALLNAGASQFSDMRRLVDSPSKASYVDDGVRVDALPSDFHTTEFFTSKLIEYIGRARAPDKPFFGYLALTAPHWPYQLPDKYLDLYQGQYDDGYDTLRERRAESVRQSGLLPEAPDSFPRLDGIPSWNSLSARERKVESRKMELYAATIEHLDLQLARLFSYLKSIDEFDSTAVFLLSDNGPEGNDRSRIATNAEWLPEAWDLSYDNMGKQDSYVFYGAGWAQASAAPLHLFKSHSSEGGTRVPMIVRMPAGKRRGELDHSFTTVMDIVPTILEIAGIDDSVSKNLERPLPTFHGASLLNLLNNSSMPPHDESYAFGWELFGHKAIRKGKWKLLSLAGERDGDSWQLFDIESDPGESKNLATQEPEKLAEMQAEWGRYVLRNNIILPDDPQRGAFGF